MRLAGLALVLAAVAVVAPVVRSVEAGPLRVGVGRTTTPSLGVTVPVGRARLDPHRLEPGERAGHHRSVAVIPQVVFVTPASCWQPGYWTYQFVPQSYAYNAWVPGQWLPGGQWIDGYYAPSVYSSGYYQPLWVEGYYTACN